MALRRRPAPRQRSGRARTAARRWWRFPALGRRPRVAQATTAEVAATVLRLAVLLQAGAAPVAAWRHIAEAGDAAARAVTERVDAGAPIAEAIEARGGPWRDVAAAWEIASVVGAPLSDSLRGMAGALRDAQESIDDVRIALAEPAGTARLMLWLPPIGLLLGFALGFDTLTVLVTNPLGVTCLLGGAALLLAARRWTDSLVRRAQPPPGTPGMHAELTAIALSGGVSIERAERLVAAAPGAPRPGSEAAGDVLALSSSAGVPAVELLRAAATHARHTARTEGRMRAAKLSSRLLLPLGVCTLPAFLLLGVAPLLLGVLTTTPLPALPG